MAAVMRFATRGALRPKHSRPQAFGVSTPISLLFPADHRTTVSPSPTRTTTSLSAGATRSPLGGCEPSSCLALARASRWQLSQRVQHIAAAIGEQIRVDGGMGQVAIAERTPERDGAVASNWICGRASLR
jgi:hypothetical protein